MLPWAVLVLDTDESPKGMATTTERGIKSNEVYYSIAYFFSQYGQQVANYSSYSSATGTNSLQLWCDATY